VEVFATGFDVSLVQDFFDKTADDGAVALHDGGGVMRSTFFHRGGKSKNTLGVTPALRGMRKR
jgi:hypothetical protein